MDSPDRRMSLALSVASMGYHPGCWRLPETPADGTMSFAHFVEMAKLAERGTFDMLFLADVASTPVSKVTDDAKYKHHVVAHEPMTLLAALAAVTDHVGLVATASTTYNHPYSLARTLSSIDHISGGRVGWNIVTGFNQDEAKNFGYESVPDSKYRYERVYEFLAVAQKLWESWGKDAFVRDKASGVYFDPNQVQPTNHSGQHFSIKGPLNIARSPQGHPLFVTAGESVGAQELAAEAAEVVYASLPDVASARSYYASLKGRLAKFGRSPDELRVLTGIMTFVGDTKEDAQRKLDRLTRYIHPEVGLKLIVPMFGDLSDLPLDEAIPYERLVGASTNHNDFAKRDVISEKLALRVRDEKLSVRQLYEVIAQGYWQLTSIGTAKDIVDEMEEWFSTAACDGFIVQPAYSPGAARDFVDNIIPELQRRGLTNKEYRGQTLRDHLGLPARTYSPA